MPYFVVFNRPDGEQVIKIYSRRLRMHEAVSQAIKGEFHTGTALVYFTETVTQINLNERVNYA
jgi:hypothetical protein